MSSSGRQPRGIAIAAVLLAQLGVAVPVLAQPTERVGGGAEPNGASASPSISADGRFVAFVSEASNLVGSDVNSVRDVFVWDRERSGAERVSLGARGEPADGASASPSISADGRFVAFVSEASNLVTGDTNAVGDVFVWDRQQRVVERVSLGAGRESAESSSFSPSISADGRFVAFVSDAANLVAGDTNSVSDVFVRDRQTGVTERVSLSGGGGQATDSSFAPSVSADGRFVGFASDAPNLVEGDTQSERDVFVHDRQTGATERVSVSSSGAPANAVSDGPSISADGRFVAFRSRASNLAADDTNGAPDVFLHDRQTRTTERVSVSSGAEQANDASAVPSISADGRFVSYSSLASSLVGGDTNRKFDVFVHDRRTAATERVSVGSAGEEANDGSGQPSETSISADGRFVAFASRASNLVAGDTNDLQDAFVRQRSVATGLPAAITLALDPAPVPVGSERCATATVTEALDTPAGGWTVEFSVSGTDPFSAQATTDESGEAVFCYSASDLPGEQTITATAQGGSNPSATATQQIVPPPSTDRCKVRYLGRISLEGGRSAAFSGFALVVGGDARGDQNYRDFGFGNGLRVESLSTDALSCAPGSAVVLGQAKAQDGSSVGYRIDLGDESGRGRLDRYRIRLGNGYDSGDRRLSSGSVDIED